MNAKLVGGFNRSEKYEFNWKSSPNRGENKTYLKPPPSKCLNDLWKPPFRSSSSWILGKLSCQNNFTIPKQIPEFRTGSLVPAPLKMNGWNLKSTQFKRKIIWTKPQFLGSSREFSRAYLLSIFSFLWSGGIWCENAFFFLKHLQIF